MLNGVYTSMNTAALSFELNCWKFDCSLHGISIDDTLQIVQPQVSSLQMQICFFDLLLHLTHKHMHARTRARASAHGIV